MPEGGTKTPIEAGLLSRLVTGVRFALSGQSATDFFGPGQPLPPVAQEQAKGRAFDFQYGVNLQQKPRANEPVTFETMRSLADSYDLLRLIIETRKDQLVALPWAIKIRDDKSTPEREDQKPDADAQAITEFLRFPDQEHTWDTWLRMLLEDLFVIDAPTIYPRMNRGGGLYALELVDGATVKRILDSTGRTPVPPDPAYQQVIKGLPAVDYSRDELLYLPRNPRTNRVYGYSPVEQIIMTVNIGLRRQLLQLDTFTSGTVPDALMSTPKEWSPQQIAEFQSYWDALLEGNSAERRKMRFVPGEMQATLLKQDSLKDDFDEWLARVVCFAFSVNPTPFLKQQNRATADNAAEQAISEGLTPLRRWVKNTLDLALAKYWQRPDLEFAWADQEAPDPLEKAQIDKIYLDAGALHPDEVRADLGRPPLTAEQKADMAPPPPVGPDGKPLTPGKKPGAKGGAGDDPAAKLEKKKGTASTVTARPWHAHGRGSVSY